MPSNDFVCPVCGATVRAKALACPECGADDRTGWSDQTIYDNTGIEDPDEFDYEEFVEREFEGRRRRRGRERLWWMTTIVILMLIAWFVVARG
jgi:predicted nucleic acid-binding Zn ribbon protein